eukprot:TRINITY_DN1709_c1_g1_i1.p2 TRINITY_DN1709_c1_g1~~TRINITY_DN1709_c1_g1_i1.p2  ORF type:complete len:201 (-),score=35.71 TRINITY_DN1709_c1_g1_i1:731-1333(-)
MALALGTFLPSLPSRTTRLGFVALATVVVVVVDDDDDLLAPVGAAFGSRGLRRWITVKPSAVTTLGRREGVFAVTPSLLPGTVPVARLPLASVVAVLLLVPPLPPFLRLRLRPFFTGSGSAACCCLAAALSWSSSSDSLAPDDESETSSECSSSLPDDSSLADDSSLELSSSVVVSLLLLDERFFFLDPTPSSLAAALNS